MTFGYRKAWYRQDELQKNYQEEEVPSIEELNDITSNISVGKLDQEFDSARAKALFVMYYLTACRVSEIVKTETLRKQVSDYDEDGIYITWHWKETHKFFGLIKKDINFKTINGHEFMIVRTENRKNKKRKTKRQPIPIEFEKILIDYLNLYLAKLSQEQQLFPFGVKRATKIINETTGFNMHFIRHIRATHLITLYDFNEQSLIKFMGWTDSRPAQRYIELSSKDLAMQFYKS